MSAFARAVTADANIDLKEWTKSVYPGAETEASITRLGNFKRTALSLSSNKFFDFISIAPTIVSSASYISNPTNNKYITRLLPRICESRSQLSLDDGRHRAACLLSMGVKVFPVIMCDISASKSGKRCDTAPDFYPLFLDSLLRFSSSQEWLAYKNTTCYKLSFSDEDKYGLFSEHFGNQRL